MNSLSTMGRISLADNRRRAGWSNEAWRRLTFLALFMMLSCLPSARAQVAASITGIVTDPSGAPVPAATVTTKNLETAAVRTATTDDFGRYLVLSLPVGQYEVRVSKPGFQERHRSSIHLVVGQEAQVHFQLFLKGMEQGIT